MKQESRPVGLTFSGQPIARVDTLIGFPPLNIVDNDLAETLVDAIKALAFTVAVARNRTVEQLGGNEAKIAAKYTLSFGRSCTSSTWSVPSSKCMRLSVWGPSSGVQARPTSVSVLLPLRKRRRYASDVLRTFPPRKTPTAIS